MMLYASYGAENMSIRIKQITSNVWNHSKPLNIASKTCFKPKLIPNIGHVKAFLLRTLGG